MAFKGLFIGVDKYQSPYINELGCAVNDAQLLYSLFLDNLPGEHDLLTDEEVTTANIYSRLGKLAEAEREDIVVITFSGHGSDQHHLITYDTDVNQLDDTAVALEGLIDSFSKINAKQVILILDCCFSGGAGAKVFNSPIKARSVTGVDKILDSLAGKGKVILTASQATEEAWESGLLRNGLFTYYLVEEMFLKSEQERGSRHSIIGLFEAASKRVHSESIKLGKEQHPTMRGVVDETIEWPPFKKGDEHKKFFPERVAVQIGSKVGELIKYGFDQQLIDTWGEGVTDFNSLQLDAINNGGLLNGNNLVVVAPTSSGKTLVGELAALRAIQSGQKAIFLFPLKALVNDKLAQFTEQYGSYGIRVIKATGESTTDDMAQLLRGKFEICLMTYEKFTSVALGSPHVLEKIGTVVVDEVQMITNENRGANLEFLLTLIKTKEKTGIKPQIVALSAVVGQTMDFEQWLDADIVRTEERPVPLVEGTIDLNGNYHFVEEGSEKSDRVVHAYPVKGSSQDVIKPLVAKLVSEGKQVIVFRSTRGEARGTANYLATSLGLPPASEVIEQLPNSDLSVMGSALRSALQGGVALHISDLTPDERVVVENSFRKKDSPIRVISATPTLAMGVNTPAEVVIISGLEHPKEVPYSVAEYKNMVGRAGRLGYSTKGESYLIVESHREANDYWSHYVNGRLEDLISRFFSSDLRTMILRIVATGTNNSGVDDLSQETIIDFIDSSFGKFLELQHGHTIPISDIPEAIQRLLEADLLALSDSGNYFLTPLGKLVAQSTLEVVSALRVIGVSKQMEPSDLSDTTLVALTQLCSELDSMYFPLNSRGATKELQSWHAEARRQGVSHWALDALMGLRGEETDRAARIKKLMACLFWMSQMSMTDIEQLIMRHGGAFNGAAGAITSTASRTGDFITVVANICGLVLKTDDLKDMSLRLQTRLETGASQEIIYLAGECGTNLS